jgi:hypothetical protein
MPGSPEHNPRTPSPPQPPWTVAEAQAVLGEIAHRLQALVGTLDAVHAGLPEPSDINDRQEGRLPYDVATDVLATIEVVLEDNLRPAIERLRRSASITASELEQEHLAWLRRRPL